MDSLDGGIRHNWYQTDSHVVVSVFLKHMKTEDVRVDLTESTLTCVANLPDGEKASLHLNLAHEICRNECTWKVLSTKIEIKLKKLIAIRWGSLKSESKPEKQKGGYPSSSTAKKDWDKLAQQVAKEEEEEHLEGDEALNKMFQKLYGDASDEAKKAMNKSFMESGGTVLSTNWSEIRGKKVEISPPDGMEWKKWDS